MFYIYARVHAIIAIFNINHVYKYYKCIICRAYTRTVEEHFYSKIWDLIFLYDGKITSLCCLWESVGTTRKTTRF